MSNLTMTSMLTKSFFGWKCANALSAKWLQILTSLSSFGGVMRLNFSFTVLLTQRITSSGEMKSQKNKALRSLHPKRCTAWCAMSERFCLLVNTHDKGLFWSFHNMMIGNDILTNQLPIIYTCSRVLNLKSK